MEKRRMCPNCRAFITTSDKVCPYCEARVGARAADLREPGGALLGGLIPHVRFTTVMILAINFALYAADLINPDINLAGRSEPWPYMHNQLYRLVTAGFLHGGIWHILMNSWVLFDLGAEVEQIYGTSRLIVFYFVSTVTGFLTSSFFAAYSSLGSSAGIFGLVGAMLAFGMTDRSSLGVTVKAVYGRWLIYLVILSAIPGVDWRAHLGGIAGGFLTGLVASTPRARLMWKEPLIRAAAGLSLAVTLLCFARMYLALTQA